MAPTKKAFGQRQEHAVSQYLHNHGYHICDMNYSCKYGEIDIVARKHDIFAFVEVKARKRPTFAMSSTVTPRKQHTLITTARHYITEHRLTSYSFRFDIALVSGENTISYIPAAFTPEDEIT